MEAKKSKRISLISEEIKKQFDIRSREFDISAAWIQDKRLIKAHIEFAGNPYGEALDLCCGTGQIGKALKEKGWEVKGLDVSESMVKISSCYFPTFQGEAEGIPFQPNRFHLVVCRQSFQFLDAKKVLSEIRRVLAPEGIFVLSLTVPFSSVDQGWLYKIHHIKQPLLLRFYTIKDLITELEKAGFSVKETKTCNVRESISRWMEYAPELGLGIRENVLSMIKNAPSSYKKLRRVRVINGEVFEDWNWIIMKASSPKV